MEKRTQKIVMICLAALTLLFGCLWQRERNNKDDLRLLAQAGAKAAYTEFSEYQRNGSESNYWKGVAEFRSFEQAYYLLTEDTNKTVNYTVCNEVYGDLVLNPQKCQEYMEDVVSVMYILAQDVEDENGYLKLSQLRNQLKYG